MRHAIAGLALLAGLSGCYTEVRELATTVVPVPPGATQEQVGKAVKLALIGRGWTPSKEAVGSVHGALVHSKQHVNILITFDAGAATISYTGGYAESQPYRLQGKTEYIEPRADTYERWIQNLAKDIPLHLQRTVILDN